jgi:hypothetical protein
VARWRRGDPEPVVPDWIRHESDGGFVLADWEWPEDRGLPAMWAEHRAKGRWVAARHRWLQEHPDVSAVLFQQLRDRIAVKRGS